MHVSSIRGRVVLAGVVPTAINIYRHAHACESFLEAAGRHEKKLDVRLDCIRDGVLCLFPSMLDPIWKMIRGG